MTAPLSMGEAAKRLGISRRTLQEMVKENPFYIANGQRKLFTGEDIRALIAVMRRAAAENREKEKP